MIRSTALVQLPDDRFGLETTTRICDSSMMYRRLAPISLEMLIMGSQIFSFSPFPTNVDSTASHPPQ